jgi:methylmalonyl-CoA/ethylmalonyl-CoA epimerase
VGLPLLVSRIGGCFLSRRRPTRLSTLNLMTPPTPRGTRVSHIGIAVEALAESLPFFRDVLGLSEVDLADSDSAKIVGLSAGEPLVELLEPEGPGSPIGRFMAKRGPGIHHICFSVDDLDDTLARCRRAGIRLIDDEPRIGAEGKRIAFLHPKSTGGVLVELSDH